MKTQKYYLFKEKNYKPISNYISKNAFFAFSNKQFAEGCEKLGFTEDKAKEMLYSIGGGGYMLKVAVKGYHKLISRYNKIDRKYLSNFKNLVNALIYEMGNHECGYTGDYIEGLEAVDFSVEQLKKDKRLLKAFRIAKKQTFKDFCKYN